MEDFSKKQKQLSYFLVVFLIFSGIYLFLHSPPSGFPLGQVITIDSGESLQSITTMLYNNHIIRSPFFFRTHVIIQGGEKRVIAGDYLLDHTAGPADLAYRLVHGKFHLEAQKVTIPEGWNIFQIGSYLEKRLVNFNLTKFLVLAKGEEGYLFPDTYFIFPTTKPDKIIDMMRSNFLKKIISIQEQILISGHSQKQVITMASILENETRTTESRRIVAGILWKRLKLGMPLQVDSTFSYINGKTTYELTADDLKIDSPYNTYKYRGLPPGPVGNPGLNSITDAVNPTVSKYLYFLSSKDGTIYYAKTFDEHQNNREKYLNK